MYPAQSKLDGSFWRTGRIVFFKVIKLGREERVGGYGRSLEGDECDQNTLYRIFKCELR